MRCQGCVREEATHICYMSRAEPFRLCTVCAAIHKQGGHAIVSLGETQEEYRTRTGDHGEER